jgi:DNA-binding response OmpR family regulator/AraC-like DNA-binding protein
VLIIEDDAVTLDTLACCFRSASFDVGVAESGSAGLSLARTQRFAAVVSDLRLPDMTGLDVLEHLRATGDLVPFLVMTGFATPGAAVRAMKLGAADFVEKPVDGDDLIDLVRSAIASRPAPALSPATPEGASCASQGSWGSAGEPVIEIRGLVDHLARGAVPSASATGQQAVQGPMRQALLTLLVRGAARSDLSIHEFLACAEATRHVALSAEGPVPLHVVDEVRKALLVFDSDIRARCSVHVARALNLLAEPGGPNSRQTEACVARRIGIDAAHLGRLFFKETGLRFRDWRRAFRLRLACRMLAETGEQVRQIAYRVGYEDASHFDHDFRRTLGLHPRAFRGLLPSVSKGSTFSS